MARKRMIDPFFWDDSKVGKLTRDERSLITGCLGQTDDRGRLSADPAFLKSAIYKYDNDLDSEMVKMLRDSCLEKMSTWPATHPYVMVLYTSSDEEYIFFPNFTATNKPSHPTESRLPAPPPETLPIFSGSPPEEIVNPSRDIRSQVRSGQVSIGKVRGVQEDFAKCLNNQKDLTDLLTTRLTEAIPAGPQQSMQMVKELWAAAGKPLDRDAFEIIFSFLGKHPPSLIAAVLSKAVVYSDNKTKPANYIKAILEEKITKGEKKKPPGSK